MINCSFLIALLFFSLFFFQNIISLSPPLKNGFSVKLIHRDSSKSPLHRVANAIHRSLNHANYYNLNNVNGNPQTVVFPDRGEYLMSYSIGTPPFKIFGIVDTGSDIVWFQCKPCDQCYNQTSPIFDPSKSTTYKNIPCSSPTCNFFDQTSCSSYRDKDKQGVCEYNISYGDESQSNGDLSMDTLTLDSTDGSPISFPKTIVGCGHHNIGFQGNSSGIVGLGGGSVSFITQLNSSIGGKFSYCLMPFFLEGEASNSSSKLNFGDLAVVSGKGTISTPIVQRIGSNIFYFLSLEGFSVGNQRIDFQGTSMETSSIGNIIIDSGTTLTLFPFDVYSKLESAVAKVVKHERVKDPTQRLSLCYKISSTQLDVPIITAHFKGADLQMNSLNTFVKVADGIMCFSFAKNENIDFAIFGNLAQQNLLVGYDLQRKTVSFKPTDCTK